MADLAAKIEKARKAGYSDSQITAYLASDGALAPKIAQAKKAAYSDTQIIRFLSAEKPSGDRRSGRGVADLVADSLGVRASTKGYNAARERLDRNAGVVGLNWSFTDQMVSHLGLSDEITGAVSGGAQAVENVFRRTTGRPVEITAEEAYRAGSDFEKDAAREYARDKPIRNVLAIGGSIAVSGGKAAAGALPRLTALQAGRNAAVLNAPFALGRQEGNLAERLPGAALETAATFGLGSALQGGANRLIGAGAGSAKRAASKAALRETVEKFNQAGVDPTLAAVKGGAASNVANALAENPFGFRQRAQLGRSVEQAGESAERIGAQYGAQRGPQIVGENVQRGVGEFSRATFGDKAGQLYDKAFSAIEAGETAALAKGGKGALIDTAKSRAAVDDTLGRVNSQALADIVTDPRLKTIAAALVDQPQSVRFNDLRALRTWVRSAQKDPQLRQGMSAAALQRLESGLTQDIHTNAERLAGSAGLKALQNADRYYRTGSQRIENALQSFADANSGESAYQRIIQAAGSTASADAQKLLSLKRSLPASNWGDVAATTLKEMGRPTKGAVGALDADAFSVSTFLTNYAKLSERGRNILFSDLGGGGAKTSALKKEIDNLADVVGKLKAVEKGANVSRSGVAAQTIATGATAVTALPLFIKLAAGSAIVGEAMTNPAFVRWLARSPKPSAGSNAAAGHLAKLETMAARQPGLVRAYQQFAEQFASENQSARPEARQGAMPR